MSEKIIGITESKGEFNGIKYHNYMITSQYSPNPTNEHYGINCKIYKVKGSYMENILNTNELKDVQAMIGLYIEDPFSDVLYDNNQRIKLIICRTHEDIN